MSANRFLRRARGLVSRRLGHRANRGGLETLSPPEFVEVVYRQLLGRSPDRQGMDAQQRALADGESRADMVLAIAQSDECRARREAAHTADDEAFVNHVYVELLQRVPDPAGVGDQVRALQAGMSRPDLVVALAHSGEYRRKVLVEDTPIADLKSLWPDRYGHATEIGNGRTVSVFEAQGPADYDWLEKAIIDHGYYEKPRLWAHDLDEDKRLSARMLSAFAPSRALEVGCANGTVMTALDDLGVFCEGVDISESAIESADPRVRGRIHQGDILDFEAEVPYDLVFGLDIFEHLNPNRLDEYLARLTAVLAPDGFVYVNVPAFGPDPVFGNVFPFYLPGWEQQAAAGSMLSPIEVDTRGYPDNGHLVWADPAWWVRRFEGSGLTRVPEVEMEFHAHHDEYFENHSRGRRTFFVFAGPKGRDHIDQVVDRIRSAVAGG